MTTKTKRRILFIASGSLLLLFTLVLALLVYLKLFGLKTALEELVAVETEEQYTLSIKKASVELSTLSFAFDSVVIRRNENLPETGVREVTIPSLQLQVANLVSMFRSSKYDIKTLVIEEPFIGIDNHVKVDTTKFHLGQQVVKLYPAIESTLKQFKIKHLKINRGALGVKNLARPPLDLRLVDFLIEEWNVARLDENSQLELQIGAQELNLEKAIFGFSGIEYNLQKRQLRIDDLAFTSIDSLSKSKVHLKAELLLLDKLGYLDLFENQRLTYEKVSIQKPNINLRLNLKEKVETQNVETNEKEVITRIVKQAVGECNIDTLVISEAEIKTVLKRGKDSTVIELPKVDFTLYTFKVTDQQEYFETGEAEIELDKTSIALTDGITFSCQKLLFDRQRNLTFEDVDLYDATNKLKVITCRSLKLTEFRILPLIFDSELAIQTITISDADINVPPDNLFGSSNGTERRGLKSIDVSRVNLKNVSLNYQTDQIDVMASGVSLNLKNIEKTRETDFTYSFHDVDITKATLLLDSAETAVSLNGLKFNNDSIFASSIGLNKAELRVLVQDISAKHGSSMTNLKQLDYTDWKKISLGKLTLNGNLPEAKQTADSTVSKDTLHFEIIEVNSLVADLKHPKFNVAVNGDNLALIKAFIVGGQIDYQSLLGNFTNLNLFASPNHIQVEKLDLDLPAQIHLQNTRYANADISLFTLETHVQNPTKTGDIWGLPQVALKDLAVQKAGENLFTSDSILVQGIRFGGTNKPHVSSLEVFKPFIQLPKKDSSKASKKPNLDMLEVFNDVIVHAGNLVLPNKKTLAFGDIKANAPNRQFNCSYLNYDLPKNNLQIKLLSLNPNQLTLDSIFITPTYEWLNAKKTKSSQIASDSILSIAGELTDTISSPISRKRNFKTALLPDSIYKQRVQKMYSEENLERSVVHAQLYQTRISGYNLDSALLAGRLENLAVDIGGFYIHTRRDKRLTDPPFEEKPATLAGLLKLPDFIDVNTINVTNGNLDVELVSDVTERTGQVALNDIWAKATIQKSEDKGLLIDLVGGAKLYGDGVVDLTYKTLDSNRFSLAAQLNEFDLEKLNAIVLPIQSIDIKSGYIKHFNLNIVADNDTATGDATITYKGLHLIIYKKGVPEKKSFGSGLLTFIADGLVLKNRKKDAYHPVIQPRRKDRVTFQYWTISAINGALQTIRHGKKEKRYKRKEKREK